MENRGETCVRTAVPRPEMRRWGTKSERAKERREEREEREDACRFRFVPRARARPNIRAEWYRKLACVTESKARWSLIWSRANERGGGGGVCGNNTRLCILCRFREIPRAFDHPRADKIQRWFTTSMLESFFTRRNPSPSQGVVSSLDYDRYWRVFGTADQGQSIASKADVDRSTS